MRSSADAITNIAEGESDVAPDVADLGGLRFSRLAGLHRLRWWVSRGLIVAGLVVMLPLAGLTGSSGAWLAQGLDSGSFFCIMALAGAMAMHRPMRKPHPLNRRLLWLSFGIAGFGLMLPVAPAQFSALIAPLTDAMPPAQGAGMGLATATGLMILSVAMLTHRTLPTLASVLVVFSPLPAVLSIASHLFDAAGHGGAPSWAWVASQVSLSFCALSVLSHHRTFRTLLSHGTLGRLVRLQLLVVGATPFVAGWALQRSDGHFQKQLLVLTLLVWLGAVVLLLTMREHERTDCRRRFLERRMLALSARDPLTGVASQRGAKFLTARLLRASREGRLALSVLMIDLDNFTSINDRHGYAVGDQILVRTARLIEGRLRSTDGLARWGGEEFVVVLPGTGKAAAIVVAEALRRTIAEQLGQAVLSSGEPVTVSIGCAEVHLGDLNIDAAIRRADEALSCAKGAGRNRVCQSTTGDFQSVIPVPRDELGQRRPAAHVR